MSFGQALHVATRLQCTTLVQPNLHCISIAVFASVTVPASAATVATDAVNVVVFSVSMMLQ